MRCAYERFSSIGGLSASGLAMKDNLNDLRAFVAVARSASFTKAGAQLCISQSALSHAIRGLEARLGVQLLRRTTRSIATTEAGELLYRRLAPLFDDISASLAELSAYRGSLKGTLRINGNEHALHWLWPKFARFLREFPGVQLDLTAENRFVDIVAGRFDAGIRLGGDLAKDMIAVRISPDLAMCCAASPAYLAGHGTPQSPADLHAHRCLSMRLMTHGGLLDWEFRHPSDGSIVRVAGQGGLISNDGLVLKQAALAGEGIVWMPQDSVADALAQGTLTAVLADWARHYQGYHLYYPNRRAHAPLLQALVSVLRE